MALSTIPNNMQAALTSAQLPASAVLQVQTSNSSAQMAFNVGEPTWTDITGMSVNITPNAVGNKIIVFGLWYYGSPSNPNGGMRCYRAETSGEEILLILAKQALQMVTL